MQAEGLDVGATHTLNVPTPLVLFGVPITRKVYAPTAPGSASEAGRAIVRAILLSLFKLPQLIEEMK